MNTLSNRLRFVFNTTRLVLRSASAVTLVVMMTVITVSAIGRYLFNAPIPGTITLVELIFLPLIIWAYIAETQYKEDHISMDLVVNELSDDVNRIVKMVFYPFMIVILLYAARSLTESTIRLYQNDVWTTGAISIPRYVSEGIIAGGVILLTLIMIMQWITWLRNLEFLKSREPPFTISGRFNK